MGQTKRGSSNSVDWVGESSCGESSISQMAETSISQTSKSQTSISGMSSIGVSIGTIQKGGISLSLRLSLGFPLAKIVTSIGTSISTIDTSIWVSGISKGSSSTRNRFISRVHTRSSFATEGKVRMGSITIGSIEDSSISFGFSSSVGSSHKGRGDNKELHIE